MTNLVEELELEVLAQPIIKKKVTVDSTSLLILIEYARQCEFVIEMMDSNPLEARKLLSKE